MASTGSTNVSLKGLVTNVMKDNTGLLYGAGFTGQYSMKEVVEMKNNFSNTGAGIAREGGYSLSDTFSSYDSLSLRVIIDPYHRMDTFNYYSNLQHGSSNVFHSTYSAGAYHPVTGLWVAAATGPPKYENEFFTDRYDTTYSGYLDKSLYQSTNDDSRMDYVNNAAGNKVFDKSESSQAIILEGGDRGRAVFGVNDASTPVTALAMWVKFDSLPSSGNYPIFGTSMGFATQGQPYKGFQVSVNSSGKIATRRGDGGGRSSSNRKSFVSAGSVTTNKWYFIVCNFHYNSNVGSDSQIIILDEDSTVSSSLSIVSGTGGAVNFGSVSNSVQTTPSATLGGFPEAPCFGTLELSGKYFRGQAGHIMYFHQSIGVLQAVNLRNNMKDYYFPFVGTGGGGGGIEGEGGGGGAL